MKKRFNAVLSFAVAVMLIFTSVPSANVIAAEEVFTAVNNSYRSAVCLSASDNDAGTLYNVAVYSENYGNQLTGLAKEFYDSLVQNFAQNKTSSSYTFTSKTTLSFSSTDTMGETVGNACQAALDAFLYDYPEIFWLYLFTTRYSYTIRGGSYVLGSISVIPEEIYEGASEKIEVFDSAVNSAYNEIKRGITDLTDRREILEEIHDYVCTNAYYATKSGREIYTAIPFFMGDGGVVCEGYSKTVKILCDKFDIPCVLVSGYADTSTTEDAPHMWNYVEMDDGKWYLIDATWDDQESRIYNTYFLANLTSQGFYKKISEERNEDTDFSNTQVMYFVYPPLSTTAYTSHTHQWESDYTTDKEPTCTENGSKSIHCSVCSITKSETVIFSKGHTEEILSAVEPTCISAGLTEGKKCSVCGIVTVPQEIIDATGHSIINFPKTEPTCTLIGNEAFVICENCDYSTYKEIAAKGHTYETHSAKEATCTEVGYNEYQTCRNCNFTTYKEIAAYGHKWTPATCISLKRCSVCKTEEGGYAEHSYTKATCTAAKTCVICEKTDGEALGHIWTIADGKKTCSVCKTVEIVPTQPTTEPTTQPTTTPTTQPTTTPTTKPSEETTTKPTTEPTTKPSVEETTKPSTAETHKHTEVVISAVAATYTADGLTEGKKCLVCGEVIVEQKKVARKTLGKVRNLKVKSTQTTEIKLSWSKVTGAESYKVYYSTNGKSWKSVKATKKPQL